MGGYLPCVRFVYPETSGAWTELLAFAPLSGASGRGGAVPVWYRVARIEGGKLAWAKYIDTPPAGVAGRGR
ncbi:MAG: hypothetical protein WDN06_07985 [Asticcacaulis sp.]